MKLNAKTIDTIQLPAGKSELVVFDDDVAGFFVRVRAGGSRTFGYQFRIGTKNRRLTLGTAVKEAFPDIRKRVLDLQAQVRLGTDPAAVKEAAVAATRREAEKSFKGVADLYLAKQEKSARPRTYGETKRYLNVTAKRLHDRPIATVTRRDIAELLTATETGVMRGTGAATANRLRANLSSMFSWAMREGLCESNPVMNTNKREQQSRSRVLSMTELVDIWRALPDDNFGMAMKILMLTAQRRNEIGGLRWSELDDGMTRITLPPERLKNKGGKDRQAHVVPLAYVARDILSRVPRIASQDCLFSTSDGISNWGQRKDELDANLPHLPHWTIHDLRRSVATHMAGDLAVLPHVVEAVLNHYSGSKAGVAGVYNHAKYLKESIAALTLWAEHLMAAISGTCAKVVPLRATM